MPRIRVDIDLTDEEFSFLLSQAHRRGYVRDARLSTGEVADRDAVRFRVLQLVEKELRTPTVRTRR